MSEFYDIERNSGNSPPRQPTHYNRRVAHRRRQNKRRRIVFITVLLIIVVTIVAIVIAITIKPSNELVGVWQYNEYTKYEFSEDGTGCLCADDVHYEYTYKLSGKKVTIDFEKDIVRDCDYTYSVENNELTLVGGKGTDGGTYKLKKIKEQ